jgi:hypothetical protein
MAFLALSMNFLTYIVFPEKIISHDFDTFIHASKTSTIQKVTHDKMMTNYLLKHKKDDIEDMSDPISAGRKGNLFYVAGSFHKAYTELFVKLDTHHSNFLMPSFKIVKVNIMPFWG